MATNERVLYARLPSNLLDALEELAALDKRSIAQEAEFIIEAYIKAHNPEYQPVPSRRTKSSKMTKAGVKPSITIDDDLMAELIASDNELGEIDEVQSEALTQAAIERELARYS